MYKEVVQSTYIHTVYTIMPGTWGFCYITFEDYYYNLLLLAFFL